MVQVESIEQYNRYFNQPTYHPLVSVANLAEADLSLFEPTDFGMYCVVLMDEDFGQLILRDNHMHYQAGTIFTMKPGQVVRMFLNHSVKPRGWMLVFRPELLSGTGLGRDFYMFNFFDYDVRDALELHDGERRIILNCFSNILAELQAPDDELTGHMLRLGISQMLSYCRRFYERQFDTGKMHSSDLIHRLDSLIDGYLSDSNPELKLHYGPPSVAWCSSQFHLSANYFGDVVKRELGISAKEYIQNKVLEMARSLLADQSLPINDVARRLGFAYSNHFTRFFCNKAGMSPSEFRKSLG